MHSRHPHDPAVLTLVSSHATSEGRISYLRCACGAWEVRSHTLVATAAPSTGRADSA